MPTFNESDIRFILRTNDVKDPDGKKAHILYKILDQMWLKKTGKHLNS